MGKAQERKPQLHSTKQVRKPLRHFSKTVLPSISHPPCQQNLTGETIAHRSQDGVLLQEAIKTSWQALPQETIPLIVLSPCNPKRQNQPGIRVATDPERALNLKMLNFAVNLTTCKKPKQLCRTPRIIYLIPRTTYLPRLQP